MKTNLLTLAFLFCGLAFAGADTKKDHDGKHSHAGEVGPNGGRILHKVEPHAEFLVTKDKKVEIRFIDDDHKVIALQAQTVSVTTGDRKNPTKLTFVKKGDKLVSEQVLPPGENNPTVVQIRVKEGDKPVTEKFNLNLAKHPGTDHYEYALGDHDDHDHKH